MSKNMIVTLFYLKPNDKNVIYKKPYKWKSTFKNAKEFKEDDIIPFVGADNHKHYGFVYKKEILDTKHHSATKWLIPYDANAKTTGRRLKRLYSDDWEKFKETILQKDNNLV